MSGLPEGWCETTVGSVSQDISYGFTTSASLTPNGPKFLRITDIQNGTVDWKAVPFCKVRPSDASRFFLEAGDIVFARTGATTGKSFLIRTTPAAVFASYLIRLRPSECILPELMAYFFQSASYWRQITENLSGSAQPNCNAAKLSSLTLPVAPLNEQRRIVAKLEKLLSRVDAAQARLTTIPRILKRFRQSVLAAACSGKLTADWREQNKGTEEYKSVTVEDIADYAGGFAYKSPTFMKSGENQVIRIGNVRPFSLKLEASPVFVPTETACATKRFQLVPGDIVISMTGTKYKRDYGYAAIVPTGETNLFLNQRVSRLRCGEKVLPLFMLYWLQTDIFRDSFFEGETGNVNQGNIGADGIRQAPIDLPSLPEQYEIVRRVDALFKTADALEARYRKAKAHVDKLTQSILAKAFRGELVPQDPNDEPASVLLDRIRQSKDGSSVKKKSAYL